MGLSRPIGIIVSQLGIGIIVSQSFFAPGLRKLIPRYDPSTEYLTNFRESTHYAVKFFSTKKTEHFLTYATEGGKGSGSQSTHVKKMLGPLPYPQGLYPIRSDAEPAPRDAPINLSAICHSRVRLLERVKLNKVLFPF